MRTRWAGTIAGRAFDPRCARPRSRSRGRASSFGPRPGPDCPRDPRLRTCRSLAPASRPSAGRPWSGRTGSPRPASRSSRTEVVPGTVPAGAGPSQGEALLPFKDRTNSLALAAGAAGGHGQAIRAPGGEGRMPWEVRPAGRAWAAPCSGPARRRARRPHGPNRQAVRTASVAPRGVRKGARQARRLPRRGVAPWPVRYHRTLRSQQARVSLRRRRSGRRRHFGPSERSPALAPAGSGRGRAVAGVRARNRPAACRTPPRSGGRSSRRGRRRSPRRWRPTCRSGPGTRRPSPARPRCRRCSRPPRR